MGELQEWKLLLKRIGVLIRKGVGMYVGQVEQEIEKKQEAKPTTKTYTCKQCGETFQRAVDIGNHVRWQHPKK